MKPLRSTLILLFLVAIGGAYLIWNERGAPVAAGAVVLMRAPENEVRRVTLQPANVVVERNSFTVRDQKTGLSAPLDSEEARGLWAQIDLVQSDLPVENPENLKQYGLENPRASIEVDGRKLEFGEVSNFDKNLIYARGSGRIGLVSATLAAKTRKTFDQWRDRDVLGSRAQNAGLFDLKNSSAQIYFEQNQSGVWRLSAAKNGVFKARADAEIVKNALRALSDAKIGRWLDERGQNPARYGLDKATVEWKSGGLNLQIGAKTSGGYAARRDGTGAIFEIPASLFATLNRPLRDWRDSRIAVFDANSVSKIEVSARGARRVLTKNEGGWKADGWKREEKREGAQADLKTRAAALDLLDFLGGLRASSFLDSTKNEAKPKFTSAKAENAKADFGFGFGSPELRIEVETESGEVADVRFGRARDQLFAQNLSGDTRSGTTFAVSANALAPAQNALDILFGPRQKAQK